MFFKSQIERRFRELEKLVITPNFRSQKFRKIILKKALHILFLGWYEKFVKNPGLEFFDYRKNSLKTNAMFLLERPKNSIKIWAVGS